MYHKTCNPRLLSHVWTCQEKKKNEKVQKKYLKEESR